MHHCGYLCDSISLVVCHSLLAFTVSLLVVMEPSATTDDFPDPRLFRCQVNASVGQTQAGCGNSRLDVQEITSQRLVARRRIVETRLSWWWCWNDAMAVNSFAGAAVDAVDWNLDKLQRVQDNLARVVCNSNRWTSAGPLLRSLHWLPVWQRINFKLAELCYLATSFQQPGYLADLISPYSQSRLLRSSTQKLLSVPPHNLDTAVRRFSVAAPRLWKFLPLNCRTAPSVNTFKIRLKTILFHSA